MDPKTQMPDIKAEVNKVDDGKKKAAGFLGLFGGGGGSAAGGLGGLGAGAAGGGGLLATKAGMLALVLMGSAVAGGIGLAGYKMFGPGDADRTGGNLSLFAPKPAQPSDAGSAAPAGDGSSQSLTLMAQSAAKDKEAEVSASAAVAAPADAAASDPAKDAAAADAARREAEARTGGAINSGGGAGAVGSMNRGLMNTKKLGALSGAVSGGGSTSASSGAAGRLGDNLAAASKNGASSGFAKGGPGAKASGARSMAARGGRGARAQARAVMGDHSGGRAGSSFAAGRTYDGSATQSGGAIGPDGGAIGMDGIGDGGASPQPKALAANSASNVNEQEPPIPTPKHMVTPWEKAVQRVQMLAMAAMVLALVAGKLLSKGKPYTWIAQWIIGGILAAMAIYAASLAYQIMTGENAQKAQGLVALAGAAGIGVMAGMVMSGSDGFGGKDMSLKNASGLMMLGGGLALISMIGGMFMPKPKQVEVQDGDKPSDISYIEIVKSPPNYTV